MAAFTFRLANYLRLREATRDERRSHLAAAYEAEALVLGKERRLEAESAVTAAAVRQSAGPGWLDIDGLIDAQRYQTMLRAQRERLAAEHQQVRNEIQQRHQALVEANRDVEVLEKLRARQEEQHRYQESRREAASLDEIAARPPDLEGERSFGID